MHCPKTFREERLDVLQQLIKAHPLATLITAGTSGLMANLIPFTLDPDNGKGILRAHLARGNSQLSEIREGAELLVVFQGPQCYISPSWYASKKEHEKVVPTWNYVTVQVRGEARVIEDATWLRAQVEILTSHQERNRAEPWHVTDAPDDFINAQIKGIVGIEIPVNAIEGKWKISQNRSTADQQGVIDGLKAENSCPAMMKLVSGVE